MMYRTTKVMLRNMETHAADLCVCCLHLKARFSDDVAKS